MNVGKSGKQMKTADTISNNTPNTSHQTAAEAYMDMHGAQMRRDRPARTMYVAD